nr:amino acid permease [uncultured Dorea sp.]
MEKEKTNEKSQGLSKVLGPMHIWALGVGIVLVGEFMGWNFTVAKGGSIGSVIALWTVAMLYVMIVMMNTEMGSVMPEAGGQYTMAKYMLGPLAAFNVGLMLVLEYAMLEAADVLVVGQILESLNPNVKALPFIILSLLVLTYMNYRGVYATLTLNFVITAVAFVTIFILLFSTSFYDPQLTLINLKKMTDGLPYGYLGIIAAMQFAVWFFLGIEGGALAAEECRSTSRALPLGTMIGLSVLLIGATTTWFVCSGLVPAERLGESAYPLYDAALATGKLYVIIALFVGTIMACLASANGCINDASRAWFAMSRDGLIPPIFAKTHPKYKTPYRATVFLLPISMAFAFTGMLDQVVTFSIFSALMVYVLTVIMMFQFRKMYPLGTIERGYVAPIHPVPALIAAVLIGMTLLGMYLGYWINILGGVAFYFLASVWFLKRRLKFIDKSQFLKAGTQKWPKPKEL